VKAVYIDSATTVQEVVNLLLEKIDMKPINRFNLTQVFNGTEKSLKSTAKLGDIMSNLEYFNENAVKRNPNFRLDFSLKFKCQLFVQKEVPKHPKEINLLYHQVCQDIQNESLPVTADLAQILGAIRFQAERRDYVPSKETTAENMFIFLYFLFDFLLYSSSF
jgi:hypothetical protein